VSGTRSALREFLSLCKVASVAAVVPLLFRRDLSHVQSWLEPASGRVRGDAAANQGTLEAVGRRVDCVIRNGRPLIRRGCLTRGVTSYYFLRRLGFDVALCFGVSSVPSGSWEGHCWLVLDGEPILEKTDPRSAFTEVVRLSALGVANSSSLTPVRDGR
jgi:hypothetical protein